MMEITRDTLEKILAGLAEQPSPRWTPPSVQTQQIQAELNCSAPKDGVVRVLTRMQAQQAPNLGEIDWDSELKQFDSIDYPDYYLQPFHSVLGGWLSETAALSDRIAMEAILENAHPGKSLGIRDEIAKLFPEDARTIVDMGSGTGDGAAAIARRFPEAQVMAIEASPFMIIVGRRQNQDVPNLSWRHGLAEQTNLPDNSVDAINITYLLHECPDPIKQLILAESLRILKPEGMIVVSDTLNGDLYSYRGFFEPYKEQWLKVNPDGLLAEAGFVNVKSCQLAYPLWTRIGFKPV